MFLAGIVLQLLFLSLLSLCSPSQLAFDLPPSTTSTTLVDALSSDPDYTSLLKLIQRALLVPTLNKLNGSTLFAPTNDAIDKHGPWSQILQLPETEFRDNVQEELRQELLYHLLNYTLPSFPDSSDSANNVQVHKTLHFPRKRVEPPSREPPPNPPWLPVPGGTLGGEPQRLRVASSKEKVLVGTDAFGDNGARVIKGRVDAGNGMLLGIDSVLTVPGDLATITMAHDSLSYFSKIITDDIFQVLNSSSATTLFLPIDDAWNALEDIERKYLESRFATDDLLKILDMHAVATDGVHWLDSFNLGANLSTISGSNLQIVRDPESGKTLVSSAELIEPDVYASNGVLHTISKLLIPPDSFSLTPEKYLLTLNCTSFVSLLHSVNLTSLINNTDAKYTILAPADDVINVFGDDEGGLPEEGSEELKRILSYHFIPGKLTQDKLKDGMLVETALSEPGLDGKQQVLEVEVGNDDGVRKGKSITFGGTTVLGDPYEYKNNLIYLISRPITPPADVMSTALPYLDFSTFLAAVFSTSLADKLKEASRTTFLIPKNDGFKRLGSLVSAHLLAAASKSDLERVVLHHVIDGVEYSKALKKGSNQSFATLEGSDIHINRSTNGSVLVTASGGWAGMNAEVKGLNALTQTGVIHELSDVLLPRSLDLSIGKLAKAAKGSIMTTMIVRAGMDWILNGTAPPDNSSWAGMDLDGVGWALLYPIDDAFKGFNLTTVYDDDRFLRSLVEQHIIPVTKSQTSRLAELPSFQSNKPILMDDSATYSTLHSNTSAYGYGDVVFRQIDAEEKEKGDYIVGIKGARGKDGMDNSAYVISWGRTTAHGGLGGVIQIDRVLLPYRPPWSLEYGAPIAVGVVGVLVIGMFFAGVRLLWRRDTSEATYEPIGGFNEDEEDS